MTSDPSADVGFPAGPSFALGFGFMPTLTGFLLFQAGYINLFWSSVFGLGGHVVEWIAPPHPAGPIDLFGILLWPILVWIGLYQLGEWIAHLPLRKARIAVGLYGGSLAMIVPLDSILNGRPGIGFAYQWLPLYLRLLA